MSWLDWLLPPATNLIGAREEIVFYPSYAYRSAEGWTMVVQGGVYDSRMRWIRRFPLTTIIRRAMRIDPMGRDMFRDRIRQFLLDAPDGRHVHVKIGERTVHVGETGVAGLFAGSVELSLEDLGYLRQTRVGSSLWVEFQAALEASDRRRLLGQAQLIEPRGVSIISDVDDTLKHSNVPNRRDLFHNTFSRSFRSIPGMPQLFQALHAAGAAFHYVSASPWQLFTPLNEFWRIEGFPSGSFHLKRFRLRDTARKFRMSKQAPHKLAAITPILDHFPERKFLLFGDSGEQDPVIYGKFLRERPHQVAGVFIRAVHNERRDDIRLQEAFADADPARWDVYPDGTTMSDAAHDALKRALADTVTPTATAMNGQC